MKNITKYFEKGMDEETIGLSCVIGVQMAVVGMLIPYELSNNPNVIISLLGGFVFFGATVSSIGYLVEKGKI